MAALRESMFLYLNWRHQSDHVDNDGDDNNNESDINDENNINDEGDINDASDNNDNFDVNDLNLTEHNSDVDDIIDSTDSVSMNTLDENSWIETVWNSSDADSFDTKINDFNENFAQSNSDGRPKFSASDLQIIPINLDLYTNSNDKPLFSVSPSQLPNDVIFPKPQHLLVGPVSTQPTITPEDDFSDLIATSTTNDEDMFYRSEFILKANTHYNPQFNEELLNPKWFIITCDPALISHTPIFYNQSDTYAEGVLVACGQFCVSNGQPLIDLSLNPIPLTNEESEFDDLDPRSFVAQDSVPCAPFSFKHDFSSPFVKDIYNIFSKFLFTIQSQTQSPSFHPTISHSLSMPSSCWSHITSESTCSFLYSNSNLIACNVFKSFNTNVNSLNYDIIPTVSTIKSRASVQQHEVVPDFNTIKSNPLVQKHEVDPNLVTLKSNALVQQHEVIPCFDTLKTNPLVQRHEVVPSFDTVKSKPLVQQHEVDANLVKLKSNALVQQHEVDPNLVTLKSNALVQQHEVVPCLDTLKSNALVQQHEVVPCLDKTVMLYKKGRFLFSFLI